MSLRDAKITALQPPPIDNLGNSSGFSFRLQDRGQKGYPALLQATAQLISEANASPILQNVYVEGLPSAGQVNLTIDREKASALGVTFEDINDTMSTNLGSTYVNDFPNRGRMQRVIVQSDRDGRRTAHDILNYNVKNSRGGLVPFSSFSSIEWSKGPTQVVGFNYYPSMRITGEAGRASPPAMRSPRWNGWPAVFRAASAMNGPVSRCRKSCRDHRRRSCSALSALVVFLAWLRFMKAGPFRWQCC